MTDADEEPVRGILYVVATPIGNLSDITFRAIEILGDVPLIAAEDTRHTRVLLDRHGIRTRMTSYHARSPAARTHALLDHLRSGADLALVSDAGTPGVSDPGGNLVLAWAAEKGVVVPIPGPSAVLAAVTGSGVAGPRWAFEGFLPRKGRQRRERLARVATEDRGTVLFEAPDRVGATLGDLAHACGADRPAAVCRELTKRHESIVRDTLGGLRAMVDSGAIPARGEFVIVVGPPLTLGKLAGRNDPDAVVAARRSVEDLVDAGVARGEAARRVAASTGLPRRALYGLQGPDQSGSDA